MSSDAPTEIIMENEGQEISTVENKDDVVLVTCKDMIKEQKEPPPCVLMDSSNQLSDASQEPPIEIIRLEAVDGDNVSTENKQEVETNVSGENDNALEPSTFLTPMLAHTVCSDEVKPSENNIENSDIPVEASKESLPSEEKAITEAHTEMALKVEGQKHVEEKIEEPTTALGLLESDSTAATEGAAIPESDCTSFVTSNLESVQVKIEEGVFTSDVDPENNLVANVSKETMEDSEEIKTEKVLESEIKETQEFETFENTPMKEDEPKPSTLESREEATSNLAEVKSDLSVQQEPAPAENHENQLSMINSIVSDVDTTKVMEDVGDPELNTEVELTSTESQS